MDPVQGRVKNGRLVVDAPTDLEEGAVQWLWPLDEEPSALSEVTPSWIDGLAPPDDDVGAPASTASPDGVPDGATSGELYYNPPTGMIVHRCTVPGPEGIRVGRLYGRARTDTRYRSILGVGEDETIHDVAIGKGTQHVVALVQTLAIDGEFWSVIASRLLRLDLSTGDSTSLKAPLNYQVTQLLSASDDGGSISCVAVKTHAKDKGGKATEYWLGEYTPDGGFEAIAALPGISR